MLVSKKENWYRVFTRNTMFYWYWINIGKLNERGEGVELRKYLEKMIWLMFGEHAISDCYTFGRAIFNNSSVISWMSVLLVERTRGRGENNHPAASHWQTLSHNVVHLTLIALTTSVVIGTDCLGSCKSNYHTITAMTAPPSNC